MTSSVDHDDHRRSDGDILWRADLAQPRDISPTSPRPLFIQNVDIGRWIPHSPHSTTPSRTHQHAVIREHEFLAPATLQVVAKFPTAYCIVWLNENNIGRTSSYTLRPNLSFSAESLPHSPQYCINNGHSNGTFSIPMGRFTVTIVSVRRKFRPLPMITVLLKNTTADDDSLFAFDGALFFRLDWST